MNVKLIRNKIPYHLPNFILPTSSLSQLYQVLEIIIESLSLNPQEIYLNITFKMCPESWTEEMA